MPLERLRSQLLLVKREGNNGAVSLAAWSEQLRIILRITTLFIVTAM
jgi:hypothetical protein